MRAGHQPRQSSPFPFSRPLSVHEVPETGLDVAIEADRPECDAVARDIGLPAIGALSATLHVTRRSGGGLGVTGTVKARITQVCVVSLEPFESEVEQPVEIDFAPVEEPVPSVRSSRRQHAEATETRAPPAALELGEDDPPDPMLNGRIDLGAVTVEFLTLGLDPYPKKPGAHFSDTAIGGVNEPIPSAFAALERLKDRS